MASHVGVTKCPAHPALATVGVAGTDAAVAGARGAPAVATARSIQHAAVGYSPAPLEDDAAVVVLAVE